MENPKLCKCGCGGEAKVIKHEYYMCSPTYGVTCYKCGTATNQGFDTEAEAIQAWNKAMGAKDINVPDKFATDNNVGDKRTAKVVRLDRHNFKCLNCGQNFHAYMWAHPTNYCSFCGAKLDWSGNEID